MKKNILKMIATASAVAFAMVPTVVNAAEISLSTASKGNNNCEVTIANYEGTRPSAMIPTKIAMTGVKECDYTVYAYVEEDNKNSLDASITITPATSFTLTKNGTSDTATATVTQEKKTFTADEVKNGASGTLNVQGGGTVNVKQATTKGHISADITSGSWTGTLVFTVS